MAVSLTVTRSTSLFGVGTNDADGDSAIDPGDIVLTKILISHSASSDVNALAVQVTDTLNGVTLVAGSVQVTPIAFDDTIATIVGNTPFIVTKGMLLGNDVDPDGLQANLVVIGFSNLNHVTITDLGSGNYRLVPETGYQGLASFEYTLQDEDGLSALTTGLVSLTISGLAWYVDSAYGGSNGASDGSFLRPFTSFTPLNDNGTGVGTPGTNDSIVGDDDVDGAGDTIFVYERIGDYLGGLFLENGQKLFGDGHEMSINGNALGASGVTANSSVTVGATTAGITLASNNEIRGLTFDTTHATAIGIEDNGGAVSTVGSSLTIGNVALTGTGKALDIDAGGDLAVSLTTLSSAGSATEGVHLAGTAVNALTGSFSAAAGHIQSSIGTGFLIGAAGGGTAGSGGSATISYGGDISSPGGSLVDVQDRSGGTVTFSGVLSDGSVAAGQTGILIGDNAGTVSIGEALVGNAGSLGSGVSITNNSGTVSFTGVGNGLDINTTTATGFNYSGSGAINIAGAGNTINTTTGQIVTMSGGTTSGISFATLHSGTVAAGSAISINNLDGSGTFSGGAVDVDGTTGASSDGINISGGSAATFTFASATIDSTGGDAIELNGANGAVTFTTVDLDGAAGNGLLISGATNAVSVNGGTIGNANNTSIGADAVNVDGGSGAITIAASLTKGNAGNLVEISNHATGQIDITGALSSGTGGTNSGLQLDNNTSGTINFTNAAKVINTGASNAITISNTNATGATINFTGGGLDIDTTSGTGLAVSSTTAGAGTVTVQGTVNTITSTTGSAINFANTNIGAADLTFRSVSSNGGSNSGIILDTTGSAGGLHITGNGSAGTGGTIANKTGADGATSQGIGIYLNNTADVQLAWMQLNNFSNFGIRGLQVNGFTLANSVVNTTVGTNGTTAALNEGSIAFGTLNSTNGLTGTASITNTTIQGGFENGLSVFNSSGTLNLTMSGLNVSGSANGDGIVTGVKGTGTLNVSINGSTFSNNRGDHYNASADGAGNLAVLFGTTVGNTLSGAPGNLGEGIAIQAGGGWSGTGSANIANNVINFAKDTPINVNVGGTGTFGATIVNNQIGNGTLDSGTDGNKDAIRLIANGDGANTAGGTLNALVQGNVLRNVDGRGIVVLGRDGGSAGDPIRINVTIIGNTLRDSPNAQGNGIRVEAGALTPDYVDIHADIGGAGVRANTFIGDWGVSAALNSSDIRVFNAIADAGFVTVYNHFNLTGYVGGATNSADVIAYLAARNTLGGGAVSASLQTPPNTWGGGGTPPQPIMAADFAPLPTPDYDLPIDQGLETQPLVVADETAGSGADQAGAGPSGDAPPPPPPPPPPAPPATVIDDGVISAAELALLVDAAIARWAAAGATAEQIAAMRAVDVSVTDMSGLFLGSSSAGRILIDQDGAGHGWFVDSTPGEDSEFEGSGTRLRADAGGAADGRTDLLTVLMHEFGHQIGLDDHYWSSDADDLMYGYAKVGERRLPGSDDASHADGSPVANTAYALSPVVIGTLPDNESVEIRFLATVNAPPPGLVTNPSNISTVSGSNFSDVNSAAEVMVLDTLSLGGTVWVDSVGNGAIDPGEGVANVGLSLYTDLDNNDAINGADALVATTLSGAGGVYTFAGLAAGNYIVVVDPANFNAGQPLANRIAITGAVDPDNDVDGDNNAAAFSGTIRTYAISLAGGAEPTTDGDADADTNNTLDLGFQDPNDAPVNSVPAAIQTFNEDGTLVFNTANANLISISDADAGSGNLRVTLSVQSGDLTLSGTTGLAFTAGDGTDDSAMTFTGNLAAINAALNGLTYEPAADYNGDRTLVVTTNDLGNSGVDPGLTGDGTSEQDSDNISIHVTAVNDAPVVTNVSPVVAATIVEDTPGAGETVTSLFGGRYSDAADAQFHGTNNPGGSSQGAFSGIAVVANGSGAGTGQWQYKNGSSAWVDIGTVSASSALLIASSTEIRFTPAPDFNGAAPTLTAHLIDNSLGFGITYGQSADISGAGATGGSSAYSAGTLVLEQSVTAVNDAPVNGVPAALQTFNEGGSLVFNSANGNLISIADADVGSGNLQVTLSVQSGDLTLSGTTGLAFTAGDGTDDSAMTFTGTLAAINAALNGLSYEPAGDYNGDRTLVVTTNDLGNSGADPGGADLTSEQDSDNILIHVTSINDAPVVINGTAIAAAAILEDTPVGQTVNTLFGGHYSDVADAQFGAGNPGGSSQGAFTGIAVVANDTGTGNGQWQYLNGASVWTDIGTVSPSAALLIANTTQIRFNPAPNFNGAAPTLTAHLIDNSLGFGITYGDIANASSTGGSTAYSADAIVLSQAITAVNDTPVNIVGGAVSINEDNQVILSDNVSPMSVSDVEATGDISYNLLVEHGTLTIRTDIPGGIQASDIQTGPGLGNGTGSLVITATQAEINLTLASANGLIYTPSANYHGSETLSVYANDGGQSGTDPNPVSVLDPVSDPDLGPITEEDVDSRTITIASINDAPVLTPPTSATITFTEGDSSIALLQGVTLSDADLPASFAGGSISLTVSGGAGSGGVNLRAGSNFQLAPDGIGGFTIVYTPGGPIAIGAITGYGTPTMAITGLTSDATLARLNDLVDDFVYVITGDNPAAGNRTVTLTFDDGGNSGGGGAQSHFVNQTLSVVALNDAPVISAPLTRAGTEDANLVFSTANANPISIADPDAALLDVQLSVLHGRITLATTAGLTFSGPGGNGQGIMRFEGTPSAVNAALDGLIYRGALNYEGSDTLAIGVNDKGGTGTPGTQSTSQSIAITLADDGFINGDDSNNDLDGTSGNDLFLVRQLGTDRWEGLAGNDGFLFGGFLDATDHVDGGDGRDELAIQGNYGTFGVGAIPFVLGADNLRNIEVLAPMPGSDTRFGDPGTNSYSYNLKSVDANVAAGARLIVDFARLAAGENMTFDGSAETDGAFTFGGGKGIDNLTGGAGADLFIFRSDGRYGASDTVNGGLGNDELSLRGSYSLTLQAGAMSSIEVLALLSGQNTRFGPIEGAFHYDITTHQANLILGQRLIVDAGQLMANETVRFDGSNETDGGFFWMGGGLGQDILIGGSSNDLLIGSGGKDSLKGGSGADVYRVRSVGESASTAYDVIDGFTFGSDTLDLPGTHNAYLQLAPGGSLSTATFDADLDAALDAQLTADLAIFFNPTAGDLAGRTFLIVDGNGVAGYQAGADFVFELINSSVPLSPPDFIV